MAVIGMPYIQIDFKAVATDITNRITAGIVCVMIRDASIPKVGFIWCRNESEVPTRWNEATVDLSQDNLDYLKRTFIGSTRGTPSKVLIVAMPVEAEGTEYFADSLDVLGFHDVDYIVPPLDILEAELTALMMWVEDKRELYRPYKLILANEPADEMWIINCVMDGTVTADGVLSAPEMLSRTAGLIAGLPLYGSGTGAIMSEVTSVPVYADNDAKVDLGELFLVHDGRNARIARAVNSLTTVPTSGNDSWRKIKIVTAMDLIASNAANIMEEARGTKPNDYDHKMILVGLMRALFTELENEGVLQSGMSTCDVDVTAQTKWLNEHGVDTSDMTEIQIRNAKTGDEVFITATVYPLDAMESFALSVSLG